MLQLLISTIEIMPLLIDPTYLRYIFDGLDSKSIHKENISALPEGLIGVYEDALPQENNVQDRERFMSFFSTWALLKKEASTSFISKLLNWDEQEVIDYLSFYTKWFNSPNSGTYILYHERLRVFLLEKISSQQLHATNQTIISLCQTALAQKMGDEWEIYALEHLASHMLITAMQDNGDGVKFRQLVYDTSCWNRQLELSKGYDWTKKMLNLAMLWAAKQSTDELIECALNNVDLHYMEQNDAPRIVELVSQNDIDTALQRIEAFGGNDKEGLQRKFTLYMLCLMELTLLDSKDKPFRKFAIEKLLNHLDENTPVDHSLLNWNDFFPSYLIFKMACEWAEMDLNFIRVFQYSDEWDSDWILSNELYTDLEFQVLSDLTTGIIEDYSKSRVFKDIAIRMAEQGKIEEALKSTLGISNESDKEKALVAISIQLAKKDKIEEALKYTLSITDESYKSNVLKVISNELANKGKIEKAIECTLGIIIASDKCCALRIISTELAKQGRIEESTLFMQEALECARSISKDWQKSRTLSEMSTELAIQKKNTESTAVMKEAFEYSRGSGEYLKNEALIAISTELAKQEKIEEALECTRDISDEFDMRGDVPQITALKSISAELINQGKVDESISVMQTAIECARGKRFGSILANLSTELTKRGQVEESESVMREAIEFSLVITINRQRSLALKDIFNELAMQGRIKKIALVMQNTLEISQGSGKELYKNSALKEASVDLVKMGKVEESLECARGISDELDRSIAFKEISTELSIQGKNEAAESVIQESLECAHSISDSSLKSRALNTISIELAKQGNVKDALECARDIHDDSQKSRTLAVISTEFANQGIIEESVQVMQAANECALGISGRLAKNYAVECISAELFKQGKIESAIESARGLSAELDMRGDIPQVRALRVMSTELYKLGKVDESALLMAEVLASARDISSNVALVGISTELAKQKKIEEALECARGISDLSDKSSALKSISSELAFQGHVELYSSIMKEALEFARSIIDESDKSSALKDISTELAKQGVWNLAEIVGSEIPQIAERQDCWKEIGKTQNKKDGCELAFKNKYKFQSEEAQSFYLKGWAESIMINDISNELEYKAIQALNSDSSSLEHFLQVYAQHVLFFGTPSKEKIERLSITLNLQWALDIIAQFPQDD